MSQQQILRDAAIVIVRQALDRAEDFVHVCDRNNDGIKLLACPEEIQRLHSALAATVRAALATADADQAPFDDAMKAARFVYRGMPMAIEALDYLQAHIDNPLPSMEPAARPAPVGAVPAPAEKFDAQFVTGALAELAHRGATPGGLALAAQLFGVEPCPSCNFRKLYCRCAAPAAPIVATLDLKALVKAAADTLIAEFAAEPDANPNEAAHNESFQAGKLAGVHYLKRAILAAEHAKHEPVECTEPSRTDCPRHCDEFCNKREVEQAKQAEGASRYLTIVFKVPAVDGPDSPVALLKRCDWTASSWSHAMNDRDEARAELMAFKAGQQAGAVQEHGKSAGGAENSRSGSRQQAGAVDGERLDWLEGMAVNVRVNLRYGSRDLFWATPSDDDGDTGPSDIRAQIDAARAASANQKGEG